MEGQRDKAAYRDARTQAWLAGPQAWLDGPDGGQTNEQMNKQKGQNLSPFLQDFVPYRGRCLKKGGHFD